VFTFSHPNWQQPADNNRAATLRFLRAVEDGVGVLHGFAGYFESVLYKGALQAVTPLCNEADLMNQGSTSTRCFVLCKQMQVRHFTTGWGAA
jgi:hypothetical protein